MRVSPLADDRETNTKLIHGYRRDRRKDALWQQHGHLVLRFLAEDVGQQLDQVLDAILAALIHRRNQQK